MIKTYIFVTLLCLILPHSFLFSQVRFTVGAKAWLATWNIPIQSLPGTEQSDYSNAILLGPYLSFRAGKFAATASYSKSAKTFEATAKNAGVYYVGFNGNRVLTREDINVFVNYSVMPEISLFLNLKLLKYNMKDALTYINTANGKFEQKFNGTGFGGGVQITVPFTGNSPLYSFISTGAVLNSFKSDQSSETGSELLYFFDGGVGYRFLPTMVGAALGLRVENGKDTRTIIGPTTNIFYTF